MKDDKCVLQDERPALGRSNETEKKDAFSPRFGTDGRYVERIADVPYRANTLVMWPNMPYSLHGVSPRPLTTVPRRYLKVSAECYRLESVGFFSVPRLPVDRASGLFGRKKVAQGATS